MTADIADPRTVSSVRSLPLRGSVVLHALLRSAETLTRRIPVLHTIRRHFSRRDAAFIAAAYAIPLPGTALVALMIVLARRGVRRLHAWWTDAPLGNAANG